jgi:hypothetical protein
MAENLDPPQIAGRHFFVDIKTMHFGRNGSPNSTTEAAAFFCTTNMGKLLQHKLTVVQCTKKSTRVPVPHVPQYGYSVY